MNLKLLSKTDIQNAFLISDVENHNEIKEKALQAIDSMGIHSVNTKNNKLLNTDWFLPQQQPRPYIPIIEPVIYQTNCAIQTLYQEKMNIITQTCWFQQYGINDYHTWHVHNLCLYSNVYYLELDQENAKTTFKLLDHEFEFEVKEGQVLSAPSFMLHCSKSNQSAKRKTVIAFNTSIANAAT